MSDADLRSVVKELTSAVVELVQQYKAKKWKDRISYVVTTVLVIFLAYYFLVDLPDRRENTRDLACYAVKLRPSGYSATTDSLRKAYDCPPFDPASVPSGVPTVEPRPGSTVTRSEPGPTRTVTRPAADPAVRTVTRTVTVPAPAPSPVVLTRNRPVPGPTTTRVVTRTATVTRGVCLPGVLC